MMNIITTWTLAHADALVEGTLIGIAAAGTWAIIAWLWGKATDAVVTRSLRRSLSLDAYASIHRIPYIAIRNQNRFPITVLAVEIVTAEMGEKEYLGEQDDHRENREPAAKTLNPGDRRCWVFRRSKDQLKSCRVFVEYPSLFRDRNYVVFKVTGKVFETMREQVASEPMPWE